MKTTNKTIREQLKAAHKNLQKSNYHNMVIRAIIKAGVIAALILVSIPAVSQRVNFKEINYLGLPYNQVIEKASKCMKYLNHDTVNGQYYEGFYYKGTGAIQYFFDKKKNCCKVKLFSIPGTIFTYDHELFNVSWKEDKNKTVFVIIKK